MLRFDRSNAYVSYNYGNGYYTFILRNYFCYLHYYKYGAVIFF